MDTKRLSASPAGQLVPVLDGHQAFVPHPLPRALALSMPLVNLLDEASRAVSRLAGVGETIPNPHLLVRPFVRREAVLSSRIEGTQASLSDLFRYDASGDARPREDVTEVANYVRALEHGLALLDSLPISLRLVNEMHRVLLKGVRGEEKRPGELRSEQVWIGPEGTPIGQSRYVPPPPDMVRDAFLDWERFVNEPTELPPLVECALMHHQFEAIHPYMDGNGRIGRSLIVLFLCAKDIVPTPLLYLSAYFDRDRQAYYDQLLQVSLTGAWEPWLHYFLTGVLDQARDATVRIRRIRELHDEYRALLQGNRVSGNTLRLLDELFASPVTTVSATAGLLGVTSAGALGILNRLRAAGILSRHDEFWPHLYIAQRLLDLIEAPIAA